MLAACMHCAHWIDILHAKPASCLLSLHLIPEPVFIFQCLCLTFWTCVSFLSLEFTFWAHCLILLWVNPDFLSLCIDLWSCMLGSEPVSCSPTMHFTCMFFTYRLCWQSWYYTCSSWILLYESDLTLHVWACVLQSELPFDVWALVFLFEFELFILHEQASDFISLYLAYSEPVS